MNNDTLITRSECAKCGENYTLRALKYVTLIEVQDAINIQFRCGFCGRSEEECRCSIRDLHRVCLSIVPMDETIKVCLPCWREHQFGDLRKYANAPFAAVLMETKIG